ncbi:MAG: CinA family nicotinamide mononucleotide deamidase-related protein [Lentisphaeria bacterium]|nr:CinA family nicotinamide mononucleotide deamidase-related protein [Lentisphaeria bacterium]MBQ7404644.1 CinA family nicotinamide mononucleotide deamidase-related protein [Lentisphaeria bacterium]
MKIAVICTGDELLKGAVLNTNLKFIGEQLLANGMIPVLSLEVRDGMEAISDALESAFSKADTVIVSGGLGPTCDDMTKEAAAKFFQLPLVQDDRTHLKLMRLWQKLKDEGRDTPSRFLNQSMIPDGAETIPNRCGTAPGIVLESERGTLFLLPGPPSELEPMFSKQIIPLILEKRKKEIHSVLLHVAGVPESVVEERMLSLITPKLNVAYCASPGLVKLFLSSPDMNFLRERLVDIKREFEKELLNLKHTTLQEEVVHLLTRSGLTLASAESCTGGLIAERITDVPGSSAVFLGGVVSYSNELKEKFLNVSPETLENYGAVSSETCHEMLNGIAASTGADVAYAVTGIAGPGGGSVEKPVGLVYTGIRINGENFVTENHFSGSRQQVREKTCAAILNELRIRLQE